MIDWTIISKKNIVEELRKKVEDKKYKLSLDDKENMIKIHKALIIKNYGEDIFDFKGRWKFKDNTLALLKCSRIVVGAHGPYIEFDEENVLFKMYVPERECWRLNGKYNVKYIYKQPVGREEKIYYQVNTVNYADYLIGKYYIDFYLLGRE